jgi:hypothetical protein
MDANIRDVLVASLPVIGGVLVAVLVARIAANRTMDLERAKWKRELYATYIHAADGVRDGVRGALLGHQNDGWAANIGIAQKALVEIKILSPGMATVAGAMWDAAGQLMTGVLKMEATHPSA